MQVDMLEKQPLIEARLGNFQSHEKTTVEFKAGVNAIVGESDSGKSSIFRAIRLVVDNKPSGSAFIRRGTENATVGLTFTGVDRSVHEATRIKGKKNVYQLDGKDLTGFGQEVPVLVTEQLAINSKLSIQRQDDPYFLLGLTGSERAKLVDSFCNIELAGKAVAIAKREALRRQREIATIDEQINKLNPKIDAITAFKAEAAGYIKTIQRGEESIAGKSVLKAKINSLRSALVDVSAARELIDKCIFAAPRIETVKIRTEEKRTLCQTVRKLKSNVNAPVLAPILVPDTASVSARISRTVELKKRLLSLQTTLAKSVIEVLDVNVFVPDSASKKSLKSKLLSLRAVLASKDSLDSDLASIMDQIGLIPVCPTCGKPI
jgi:DNA repair exonuclease SbcCD ATPase subunit